MHQRQISIRPSPLEEAVQSRYCDTLPGYRGLGVVRVPVLAASFVRRPACSAQQLDIILYDSPVLQHGHARVFFYLSRHTHASGAGISHRMFAIQAAVCKRSPTMQIGCKLRRSLPCPAHQSRRNLAPGFRTDPEGIPRCFPFA